MPTKADKKKTINQRLRYLRATWRRWRAAETDDPGRIDFDLVCPIHRNTYRKGRPLVCGDPTCEGCASTLYRADRMGQAKTEIDTLKAQLLDLDGKPVGPAQEPLFP